MTMNGGPFDPITEFTRPIPGDRDGRVEGDSIRIAGEWCPGFAVPRRASDPRSWDVRPGYGLSGATLIYKGDDLSRFDVDVTMLTQTQVDEFKVFQAKYLARKQPNTATLTAGDPFLANLRPKALGIYNPALALLKITSVQVEDVTQFDQVGDGVWACVVKLIVDRPPLPLLFKPDGKIPDTNKKAPTARDELERKIQEKLDKIDKLEDNLARGG